MTEINPPFALQNAGATHTAENDRMTSVSGLMAGIRTAGSLVGRGGVHPMAGGILAVTQTGTASMNLQVASGICYVAGTEGSKQGMYGCTNDATDTVTVTAAHGTLPRIDSVVARIQDSAYSGSNNFWTLEVVAGTAAASPVAPTLPANCLKLYDVNVGAAVTSITNANLVDRRVYATTNGGIIPVKDTAERDALLTLVPNGQGVFVLSTSILEFKVGGAWVPRSPQRTLFTNQVSTPTFSIGGSYVDFTTPQWAPITFTAPPSGIFEVTVGAVITNNFSGSASMIVGFRVSGGLTVSASGNNIIWVVGTTAAMSRTFTYSGATPGASVTVTPQWQITSGTAAGASVANGQLKVKLST